MAGWPVLPDGSSLDYYEIIRNLQINGFCLGLDDSAMKVSSVGGSEESEDSNLRCWFDRILVDFFKEISVGQVFRPIPAMLGDGSTLDLFKLFWAVRVKGGFNSVSKHGLWASVAEESGLCSEVASSVKLLYFKYLDSLDRWVQRFCKHKDIGEDEANCSGKLGLMLVELDSEFRDFFYEQRKIVEDSDQLSSYENKFLVADVRNSENTNNKCVDKDEDVMILDPSTVNEEMFSSKRKRETLSGIMDWVREIAKNPGDSTIEKVEETSKQKTNGVADYRDLTLLARSALFQKGHASLSAESSPLQKKQKIHPSMYGDQLAVIKQPMDIRCSPRILSQKISKVPLCSDSCIATQIDLDRSIIPMTAGVENYLDKQLLKISDSSTDDKIDPFDDDQHIKDVSIGPLFQAEVPEWTGVAFESDSKWLGTQQWPVITEEQNSPVGIDSIGKGRQDSCDCLVPGSIECARFHIAETRLRVKLELGSAFYNWRFQFLGEEVSLSWTKEEEKIFKSIVKSNSPSLEKSFWDQASARFPNKKMTSLVSYYFNVFLLRRRCFQNRVTPNNISSDDEGGDDNHEESEFGVVSNGFLYEKR